MSTAAPALPPSPLSRRRGMVQLVLSAVMFGAMAFLVKRASLRLEGAQVALVRFAVGLSVVALQSAVRRVPLKPRRADLLLLRGLFGGSAVLLYFLAIQHLPVGTATLLNFTSPVFTAVFASLFIAEVSVPAVWAALGLTVVGVSLVVYGQGIDLGGGYQWQAVALVSAVLSGAAVTTIRAARRFNGPWEIFGAFCSLGCLCTAPLAWLGWRPPTSGEWLLLVALGLASVLAQVLMTHALGAVDAPTSGIVNQLTVVFTLALGVLVDRDPFGPLSLAGTAVTLAGVSWAAWASAAPEKE